MCAVDIKYGAVQTERGKIGDDEVVVVFRAQDALIRTLLACYKGLSESAGSPKEHIEGIDTAMQAISRWQNKNPELVKIPD